MKRYFILLFYKKYFFLKKYKKYILFRKFKGGDRERTMVKFSYLGGDFSTQ